MLLPRVFKDKTLDNAFYVVLLASGIGLYKAGGITGISSYI
jgi:hypothetical protein